MKPSALHIIDHLSLGGTQRTLEGNIRHDPSLWYLALRRHKNGKTMLELPPEQSFVRLNQSPLAYFFSFLSVPRLLRENNIQFVHCHLFASWMFGMVLSLLTRRNTDIQYIFHEHDANRMDRWYYPLFLQRAARAGMIVAISEDVRQQIIAYGIPAEKVHVILNYINPMFEPGPKTRADVPIPSHWPPDAFIIGSAMRLISSKGWNDVLEIAQQCREYPVYFLVAGDGPDFDEFQTRINAAGLEKNIHLMGYYSDMLAFYRSIDLFLFTSYRETFGLAPVEAQACGVPVIVYDIPIFREILQSGSAVFVPIADTTAMAQAAVLLMKDPQQCAALREAGLQNSNRYHIQKHHKKMDEIHTILMEHK